MTRSFADTSPHQQPAANPALDASAILASIGELPYAWSIATDALSWGPNVRQVLTVAGDAVATGRLYAQLLASDNVASRYDAVMGASDRDTGEGVPYTIEYGILVRGDPPRKIWVEDKGRWFGGPDGSPVHAHGIVRIVNDRHAREEQLAFLSQFDDLTGEINRTRLSELLRAALEDASVCRTSCGFLLVGIDNFSRLNEAYGYAVADDVIRAVGKRLRAKMRGADVLGRMSGNKFGVVLKACTPDEMAAAAERLIASVGDDVVQTQAGPVAVTVTVGGVAGPRHARTLEEMLSRAKEALAAAKAKRLGSFLAYAPSVEREAQRQANVRATDEIVGALNDRRILIAFEPVIEAGSRRLAFHECLMRIRRADGTLLPASSVIPVAERLGLIRLIDQRMLELVIAKLAAMPDLRASLNVSPASTTDPDWWSGIVALLRKHPSVGARLIIEITEMSAIRNVDETRGFVTRVKDFGCRIAIDDFGAGYTSFRNLRKLGVDIVKIDGAFIEHLTTSEDDRVFVRALIELARGLGLETVAEWLQDEEAASLLCGWGCQYLQGALVGPPVMELPTATAAAIDNGTLASTIR